MTLEELTIELTIFILCMASYFIGFIVGKILK